MIGRFMQADPHIQFAGNLQSYNRYSYVMNNPMKYTDPSGYFLAGIFKKYWRTILSIGLSIWAPWGTGFFASIATGAAAGYITTGSLKGALVGGLTAGLFHGVGTYFEGMKNSAGALSNAAKVGKVLAHGFVGGVSSVLSGGKFGHGFASAGVTQAFADSISEIGGKADANGLHNDAYYNIANRARRVVAAAAVGGTASVASGGKFSNGAITGAFSRAFNDEAQHLVEAEVELGLSIGKIFEATIDSKGDLAAKIVVEKDGFALEIDQMGKMTLVGKTTNSSVDVELGNIDNIKGLQPLLKSLNRTIYDFKAISISGKVDTLGNFELKSSLKLFGAANVNVNLKFDPIRMLMFTRVGQVLRSYQQNTAGFARNEEMMRQSGAR